MTTQRYLIVAATLLAGLNVLTAQLPPKPADACKFDNMTAGLPCAKECPCYKDRAPGDCLSFDEFGASLICVNIESNATLAAALNETNDAKVFEPSSVIGTCSRYAKYLDTWAKLTDAMKQKIIAFFSDPTDTSITYQDVDKMPIQAFAAINKTLWRSILMNAPDRLKLSIQMKIMMSNDCEVHSMLKGLNFTDLYKISESKYEVDSSIFEEDFCKAILRNCSKVTPDMWLFLNISAPNCFIYITPECFGIKDFGNHSSYDYWNYDKQGNSSGLPCPRECPCYRGELAAGDQLAYDSYGIPLPCAKIDMNTTLSTARNETSMAMVFEASSVMGTCSRLAKYLDTWARLTDAMKQKIIAFFSDPTDTSITYQDVDKMPIQAFAAINKTLWHGILMNAPDRLKLSIQMKIMMSNDCEVHSMLKGLNFTDLYKISESKYEVDSSIFEEDFCKAILRNCSKVTPDMWLFLNISAPNCFIYITPECFGIKDFGNHSSYDYWNYDKQGNSSGLPCPRECPCYRGELAAGDQLAYDSYGIPLPCAKIDMNTTLSTARNETSMAMVFEASSVMGTCSRLAKYLDTWARLTDAMKQKIIAFFSDPTDTSITYQDVDKMPIQAFAAINKTLWHGILMNAPDRLKFSIQMKIMMSNDCEVHSMLKGLNFTDLYKISESKGEVDSSIFQEDFCKAILRNCSKVTLDMWLFLNISAPNCFIYITPECFGIKDFGNHSSYDYWNYDKQGNSSGLPCPRECPCYRGELAAGDQLAYDSYGIPLPCAKIDMNTTLSTARNETSMAMVFEASSVMGTCSRLAKYLDTWARLTDAMKQKIIAFFSDPTDTSITYQDVDKMPIQAFAAINKTLWHGILMNAPDRLKFSIQMKIMMSNDCEVHSMLKGLNFTDLYKISESKGEVDSSIFQEDFCKAILRNCSKVTLDMWLFLNISAPNCFIYITPECFGIKDFGNHSSYDYWNYGNSSGLPCPRECPCYRGELAAGDQLAYDSYGIPLPCPKIDTNITLLTARSETSMAMVFEVSSVMGTCSRLAKYLEAWARLTDAMKQKIIAFFSDPTDTSITYQDVDKMPIQAFAAINKTLWRGILMNAPDRLKLSIQMKIMMSNDCEVHSMLKGLNFTDLYKISESKGEVDSTIFQEGFCKAILRNCSKLTPDMWMFLNASAYSCLPYVPQDCAQPQDMFSSLRNSTDFSRPPMSTDGMSRSSPLPMFSGSPTFPPRSSDVISRSSPLPMISGSTPFRTMSSDGIPRSSPLPMISGSTPFRTMSSDGMLSRTGPMLTSPQRPLPSDSPSPTGLMMTSSPMPSGSLPPPREIVGSNTGEIPPADYSVVMYSGCDAGAEGLRCPSNCSDCYQGKLATDCYSYDKYGNFLGCRTFAGNATLMRALNDTTVAKVFNATAEIGTCSRLKKYLRKWISLDSATRDKSIQFLKDPKSVSDEDVVDKIPVEVFAVANRTLLDNVTQQASIKQKLYLATTSYLSRSCEIQDHLKSFDLEQSYKDALQAGNVDASYFNTSLCKAYMAGKCDISMSKWRFALDNAQECVLDKAVCLKDVKDATLDSLFTVTSIKQLCNRTDVEATAQDLFRRRMNSYLGNKTTFACDADFLQVMKVCSLDPKFVIKFCDQSKIPMFSPSEEHADEWNILKAEALQSANTDFSSLDKATLVSYLPISKSLMKTLDKSTLDKVKEAVCTDDVLAGVTFSEDDIRDVLDVLLTKGVLNKTTDKACLVKYAPMEVADLMDATDLRNNYDNGNLNVTKLTQTQSKEIWEMVKTELTSDTKIKENAELIIRHGPSTLDSLGIPLTKDTAKTILNAVKNTDNINPAVKTSAMMASYDDSDPAESLKMIMSASSEEMLSFFPIKKIMSIAPASLTALCGSALTADIPKKLGKALMNKCQDAGTQLDLSTVTNLLPIIGSAPKERFDAIDTNSADCASILSKIAESTSITAEKYEYVCQKLHTCVSSSNLDLSDASTLSGNALACFNKTMLNTLGGSCSDITTKICSADFSIMDGKSRKTDIKEYALECLSVSSTLTESSIDSLGNCVELLGSTEISKMDKSATKAVIKALSGSGDRFTCWTMAEKFMARYSAVKGSDIISVTDIMGTFNDWTVGLQTADFSSLSGLCDTISAIGKSFKKRGALKRKLKKAGLLTECSEDYDAIRTEIKGYISAALQACSASRRRKRTTASITCAQLTDMGASMLSSLTTSQLSGIQDTDFTQCASLLGSPTDYSTEQKQALATVAKRATVYGAPSTWSSATIQSLGSINQGLTSTEHDTMTFTYDDIAQLGAFSEWEDTQKTTIFSKWTKSSSISTITSSELRSLGHMTCAMTTSQIQQITTSVYEDSADKVGEVTSCSATQMVEFANHAKTVYGSTVYNWTTVQITNVGVHIGGLSKTEIATLTDTQIDEILASHITLIPSSVFSGFTATQLRNLSPAQAQATTTTQRSTLSASQISALEAAAGVSYTSSSGVERSVQVSWLVLALTVVLKLSL